MHTYTIAPKSNGYEKKVHTNERNLYIKKRISCLRYIAYSKWTSNSRVHYSSIFTYSKHGFRYCMCPKQLNVHTHTPKKKNRVWKKTIEFRNSTLTLHLIAITNSWYNLTHAYAITSMWCGDRCRFSRK